MSSLGILLLAAAMTAGHASGLQKLDLILPLAGRWTVEAHRTIGPEKGDVEQGAATGHVILNGQFLELQTRRGAAESLAIVGYDTRWNEFTFHGFDTLGDYSITARGQWDQRSSTLLFHGADYDPQTKTSTPFRIRIHLVSDREFRLSVALLAGDNGETLVADAIYTRAK